MDKNSKYLYPYLHLEAKKQTDIKKMKYLNMIDCTKMYRMYGNFFYIRLSPHDLYMNTLCFRSNFHGYNC